MRKQCDEKRMKRVDVFAKIRKYSDMPIERLFYDENSNEF
jgi:hypothetical protein